MNAQRLKCERKILKIMEILDDPKKHNGESPNVEFWVRQFAKMSDKQFEEFVCTPLSIYYQTQGFKYEPSMIDIIKGLDEINVPLLEEIYMPYKYKDKDGRPVKSQKAVVIYIHLKRMKQLQSIKAHMTFSTKSRDAKTGLLTWESKVARESDREFEGLAIMGLNACMKEMSKSRADSITDKNIMNSTIKSMGTVRLDELPDDPTDSMAKNMLSIYFLGAGLMTNLVNTEYMTPWTLKTKENRIQYL